MNRSVMVVSLFWMTLIPRDAFAQEPARVLAVVGTVEIVKGRESLAAVPNQPVYTGEKVRTGISSIAVIGLPSESVATIGENTEVELRLLGPAAVVWLDRGQLRIDGEAQVHTRVGRFVIAEKPGEVDFEFVGGSLQVTVLSGALRTPSLDPTAVVFRAGDPRASRNYRAATFRPKHRNTVPFYSGIYVPPYALFLPQQPISSSPFPTVPRFIVPTMTDPLRPPVQFPIGRPCP